MDGSRFDALAQSFATSRDRRGIVRLVAVSALGGLVLAGASDADAKRKKNNKKITICHNGQTITVSKNAKKGHLKHGDTLGECPPPPPSNLCGDGVQNGAETDVDCGGGTCPRCAVGKKCSTRNDCTSGLCVSGLCKSCDNAGECGVDAAGNPCACRTSRNVSGLKYCSNVDGGTLSPGNSCNRCNANQGCSEADGGAQSECSLLCGAT